MYRFSAKYSTILCPYRKTWVKTILFWKLLLIKIRSVFRISVFPISYHQQIFKKVFVNRFLLLCSDVCFVFRFFRLRFCQGGWGAWDVRCLGYTEITAWHKVQTQLSTLKVHDVNENGLGCAEFHLIYIIAFDVVWNTAHYNMIWNLCIEIKKINKSQAPHFFGVRRIKV